MEIFEPWGNGVLGLVFILNSSRNMKLALGVSHNPRCLKKILKIRGMGNPERCMIIITRMPK